MTSDSPAAGNPASIPDQPQAQSRCEHYWAYHCYGGLSVRLCQFCHEPDWDSVRADLEEAQRKGIAAERERLFTAIRHKIPLSQSWRGEALDLIWEVWRDTDG